jgi:PAS domain S-box-containing protein
VEDLELEINRHGFVEESHFTVAYSPVPDESAPRGIGGVLATVHEITEKVIGQRRVGILSRLSARVAEAKSSEQACEIAMETLAQHPKDVPFGLLYLLNETGTQLRRVCEARISREMAGPVMVNANAPRPQVPWPLDRALQTESLQTVTDLTAILPRVTLGPWSDSPTAAAVVPIRSNVAHRPAGALVVGISARLRFDTLYANFLDLVGSTIATAVANARAYEEERCRAEALAEIDRAKTTFFSNVSHEFRTPLTLLLSPLQDALERPAEGLRGEPLASAHCNALRLLRLVNALLDFSRIQAGRVQASFVPTDLTVATEDLASVFRSTMERAGLRYTVSCQSRPALLEPRPTARRDGSAPRARVLVVDDNADMRDYLKRLLSSRFSVLTADGGQRALDLIGMDAPPDLVLSDVMMPRLDGIELLRALRANPRTQDIPVILLSARAGEEASIEGLEAGADAYLIKPFSARELLARVASLLELARVRREAEKALRYRSEQYATLLNQAPLGVYLVDADFRIREVNPIALPVFGDIEGGIAGRDFDEIMHILWEKDYADELVRIFRRTLETGEPYVAPERAQYRIDRGATEYYEWRVDRITLPDGRFGAVCYFRICLQVETRVALREADRRKDVFLATLSHELRNPLAPIRTAAQILRSRQLSPEQLQWAQHVIQRQAAHMALLLDDLLDITRITQGKLKLRPERVHLTDVVDSAVESARPLLEGRNHRLTVILPPEPLTLDADPLRLSQVLSNLLTNAAKYTDPGGAVDLRAEVRNGMLRLSVKDNGIGIPPVSLKRIFDMFSQVEGTSRRANGGLGIGLALVKGVVELHGGTVEARSESPGHGSQFIVRLPLAACASPAGPAATVKPPSTAKAARRVLVADDNRDAADSLVMLLELAGHEGRVAHCGRAALSLARTFRPDVALLDIGMPELNGYEVARAIRREPWGAAICLIALTGWGQEDDRQRTSAAGFNHHLTKPVDPDALEALIARGVTR